MGRSWIDGGRSNVIDLRARTKPSPRHPSMLDRDVEMFDQDTAAADRCVLLTMVEAQAIAGLLRSARSHLPSPKACDEAIALLTPKRPKGA